MIGIVDEGILLGENSGKIGFDHGIAFWQINWRK